MLDNMKSMSVDEIKRVYNINPTFWIGSIVLTFVSSLALAFWLKQMKIEATTTKHKSKLGNLQSHEGEVMNYFSSYIIPILSLDIGSNTSIIMNMILIIIIGVYFVRNNNLQYNILLLIIGYHIYSDDVNNIVISKKKLYDINNKRLEAEQIGTSNIFYI